MNLTRVKQQNPTHLTKDIQTFKRGRKRFYIDPRTITSVDGIPIVKPFAWNHTYLWIVCPHCQRIHEYPIVRTHKDGGIVYGNCKGRLPYGIDSQPIQIDMSGMTSRKE